MNIKPVSFKLQGGRHPLMKPAKLNLVSLMDIFTILVFFLLLNSGNNEILKVNRDIELPESSAEQQPEETITVMITAEDILVDGRPVATMEEVTSSNGLIKGLMDELNYQASKRAELTEEEKAAGRAVTILGDQEVPYEILKRVMLSCAKVNYRDLSMAVSRVASSST
ncbi:biopolymer transporter ExbD [Hahella sp. CCB-MM4]|uniref:ExbD/TolR family protein n=1 Tax=Hahella sp. (strain CCB-MM4) TaxID=1926491 RepID=UPI000B9AC8C1|nr:biopolymer transporter ExbD [Hahella sp. CCB-MM4]